jgi:hypothetical protein
MPLAWKPVPLDRFPKQLRPILPMKQTAWLSLAFLVFSHSLYAFEPKIEIVEQFDDFSVVAYIPGTDFADNPPWNAGVDAPPLSVYEAITAVRNFQENAEVELPVREVELRTMPRHEKSWHYLIRVENAERQSRNEIYVVLMNGKVIPAVIKPNA